MFEFFILQHYLLESFRKVSVKKQWKTIYFRTSIQIHSTFPLWILFLDKIPTNKLTNLTVRLLIIVFVTSNIN